MGGILTKGVWILLLLALMSFIASAQEIPLTSCGNITTPGNYYLVNDVNSNTTCFLVQANEVTLDCRGNNITTRGYNNVGPAILAQSVSHLITRSCRIFAAGHGIKFDLVQESAIINNSISTSQGSPRTGIYLNRSSYNIINDNVISTQLEQGIFLEHSFNNTVSFNVIETYSAYGIYFFDSPNNTIVSNAVSTSSSYISSPYGVYILDSPRVIIINNTISTQASNAHSLYVSGNSKYSIIRDNVISTLGWSAYGLLLTSDSLVIGNNNINAVDSYNIRIGNLYNHTIFNNTGNGRPIISLSNKSDLVLDLSAQDIIGIIITRSRNITIKNANFRGDGIQIGYMDSSLIQNSTIVTSKYYVNGIDAVNSNENTFIANTITTSRGGRGLSLSGLNNTLSFNTVTVSTPVYSSVGIGITSGLHNKLVANTVSVTGQFDVSGLGGGVLLFSSMNSTIDANAISTSGTAGIRTRYSSGNDIVSNLIDVSNNGIYGGLHFDNSLSFTVINNTITTSSTPAILKSGMLIGGGRDVFIANTIATSGASTRVITLWNIAGIDIINNSIFISDVTAHGNSISVGNSLIKGNKIKTSVSTAYGFELYGSNNQIYDNLINTSASQPVNIIGVNNWNTSLQPGSNIVHGPYVGGNFYAHFNGSGFSETCPDTNSDGICDQPLRHNQDNIDYLPLTKPPTTSNPPVLLIHGIYSNDQIWNQAEAALENEGFDVYRVGEVLNQPGLVPNNGNIIELSGQVKRAIDIVKSQTGASKVNIIAHSLGGLATRFYIRTNYQNDIDKLITLGTPNEGAPIARGPIARFFGQIQGNDTLDLARFQMIPDSTFLQLLNSNFDARGINHTEIAGTSTNPIVLFVQPSYAFRITDSIVPRSSVNIPNIACFQNRNTHTDILGTAYYEDQIILTAIANILKGQPITLRSCPTEQLDQPEQGNNVQVRSISNTINPHERQIAIENLSGIKIGGLLQWESGDLHLEFVTPSGNIINATTYAQYLNVTYSNESTPEGRLEWIALDEPEAGNYSVRVVAANIPAPQQYTLIAFIETSIILEAITDKATYRPNEPAIINAYLTESYQPILNVSVTAIVIKPDRSGIQVTLFDDGYHYDRNASDGVYGNLFNETEREGLYLVDVNASIANRFKLLDATNFFVELFPDLKVDEADITITPSSLIPGENATVTVQAAIHNIGEKDATNTTIEFYDGDPAQNGVRFGNRTVNIPVNSSIAVAADLPIIFMGNASLKTEGMPSLNSAINFTMLDTSMMTRNLHAIISPFASYLESNYTNNHAKKPLRYANVTYVLAFSLGTTPGIPLGDGRVIPLNFDPLLLLSIQAPMSFGLENSIGILENGGAIARFNVPNVPELRGLTVYAASVTIYPQGSQPFVSISNAVPLRFV